jgi:hypothetical protein
MSLKFQSSFAAGEIDPALHERTNLQKFSSALATGRCVIVGKTGRLISKPGRRIFKKAKFDDDATIVIHPMPRIGMLLEFGNLYLRVWNVTTGALAQEIVTTFTTAMLPDLKFQNIKEQIVMITRDGAAAWLFYPSTQTDGVDIEATTWALGANPFNVPEAPTYVSFTAIDVPAGHAVEYAVTAVVNGQESLPLTSASLVGALPLNVTESNEIVCKYTALKLWNFYVWHGWQLAGTDVIANAVFEFKVYRRPSGAGAYGYIGSTTALTAINVGGFVSGTFQNDEVSGKFTDFGGGADYTHQPPSANDTVRSDFGPTGTPVNTGINSACVYQQRLLLGIDDHIETSRPGYPFNFTRDYPINSDSSLSFKSASEGSSKVLWMIENDGMVVFTGSGVFLHNGVLSPTNLALPKKGNWVIDQRVPPISIPGGVLFVDRSTNTVRQLLFSQELQTYSGEELSIFNNHLFAGNRITSWAFEEGDTPILWVVFSNGTYASFTFERDHQMRAWTRHDSGTDIERVAFMSSSPDSDFYDVLDVGQMFFVVNKDGVRWIEIGVPRYVSAAIKELDAEWDKNHSIAAMDGIASYSYLINDDLTDDDLVITPDVAGEWDGPLTLSCTDDAIFGQTTLGAEGEVFRFFDEDGASYDLEVTARLSDNAVTVEPSAEFPSGSATNPRLYWCKDVFQTTYSYDNSDELVQYIGANDFVVAPVSPGVWDGPLTITQNGGVGIFTQAFIDAFESGNGKTFLKATKGATTIMEITGRTSDLIITVLPQSTYPSDGTNPTLTTIGDLYMVFQHVDYCLDHLEDENVSVIGDGYVVASPNNTVDFTEDDLLTVNNGLVVLPEKYAIVHIGRPYVMDVETLDVDTVEQRPILIEDKTLNKLYIKVYNTRGLYVASRFPAGDTLTGMDTSGVHEVGMSDTDTIPSDYGEDNNEDAIIANRYPRARTKRVEITLPGDWKSNGRVCIRQVDPLHFEILSILLDLEDLRRER